MGKKVLQELIENAKQNEKFIYQRYNGLITKYIDNEDYYINCETGFAIEKNEHLILGKKSENIIDLVEVGDILKMKEGNEVCYIGLEKDTTTISYKDIKASIKKGECELLEILTKEQYEANCYEVGGEDE